MPEKPSKLLPAMYGGIIMGVISGIPFLSFVNCLCCAGVMFGGFMAVFFYKKDMKPESPPLTNNDGIALGALAGVFGAVVGTILGALLLFTIGNVVGEAMMKLVQGMGVMDSMPPEAIEQMEKSMVDGGLSPVSVVVSFIINPLFGLIGGMIGYAVFKVKPGATPQMPVQA
jgi:hypothetical protein